MDSDSENLLVIDETRRPETPVSDSSERDKTNSSRDKANKENREISQTCISTPASTSSISSNLFNAKEKEHGSAKSESHKSNKSKLNQQTEKRDDAEKKKYAFRLTHLEDFETKLLRVSSLQIKFEFEINLIFLVVFAISIGNRIAPSILQHAFLLGERRLSRL